MRQVQLPYHGGIDPARYFADSLTPTPEVIVSPEISPVHHAQHLELARSEHVPGIGDMAFVQQDRVGAELEIGHDLVLRSATSDAEAHTSTFALELGRQRGRAKELAVLASNRVEVKATPEVGTALEGYYTDHLTTAELVKGFVQGRVDTETCDAVIDGAYDSECVALNSRMRTMASLYQQSRGLQDPRATDQLFRAAAHTVETGLFQEVSLGATTLDPDLVSETVGQCIQTIHEQAAARGVIRQRPDGVYVWGGQSDSDYPAELRDRYKMSEPGYVEERLYSIRQTGRLFWQDARPAGQLEFHNTPYLGQTVQSGWRLASRTSQANKTGTFLANTNVLNQPHQHTNLPHFAEKFDPFGYRSNRDSHGGTVALPLAEVVSQLPYAREGEYAVLEARDPAVLGKVTTVRGIGEIGAGRPDSIGADGMDRVFYGSATDSKAAASKDIIFGGKQFFGSAHDPLDPSLPSSFVIRTGRDLAGTHSDFGAGQYYPTELRLDWYDDTPSDKPATVLAADRQRLETVIDSLQAQVLERPRYRNKIVGALRSGVIGYDNESHTDRGRGREFLTFDKSGGGNAMLVDPQAIASARQKRDGSNAAHE